MKTVWRKACKFLPSLQRSEGIKSIKGCWGKFPRKLGENKITPKLSMPQMAAVCENRKWFWLIKHECKTILIPIQSFHINAVFSVFICRSSHKTVSLWEKGKNLNFLMSLNFSDNIEQFCSFPLDNIVNQIFLSCQTRRPQLGHVTKHSCMENYNCRKIRINLYMESVMCTTV